MIDFAKRLLIAMGVAVCITVLFFGVKVTHAQADNKAIQNVDELNWTWPTEGVVSDPFGTRGGKHYGIDIAANTGTPVLASEGGEVIRSYYSNTYGNVVFLAHDNGMQTVYAHMNKRLVTKGDKVKKGDPIGVVGNTGRSSGSHLHFEVHNGAWNINKTLAIDPARVMADSQQYVVKQQKIHTENSITASSSSVMEDHTSESEVSEKIVIPIERGDTLWDFSQQYDVSVSDLKEWNNLDSSLIIAGEQLIVYADQLDNKEEPR